ncbi:MAG: hypothetical protein PHW00_03240 [Clostridia bacterium]|nr:hypothetical protein [Clostridia bacterium]
MRKQGTNNIGKAVAYIAIVLVIVAVCGLLAYFTNGFTSDFKTFYVESNGKQVLSTSDGFEMTTTDPMKVDVKYTFGALNNEVSGYSVKVVPNAISGKDFDLVLDGAAYSFQDEDDMTAGFIIEQEETSFTITPKGGINDILQAVYPTYEIGDARAYAYENMFTLVVTSYNGEASVKLNFTVVEKIEGVILDKEVIEF